MTLLQVADLRFGYAGEFLFEGVTFSLARGDRAALVAPNGAGKSTLLRLVAGEMEPDAGSAVIRRGTKFGYYRQSHEVKAEGDVLGAFLQGFREVVALREQLHEAQQKVASGDEQALARLASLTDQYHLARGDELEREVGMLANQLGFSNSDLERPVSSLSGGERGRLNLGVVLAEQPDLLVLDEPTNHLDLDTIAWLESYLATFRGAAVIVSHDRAFLDNTSTQTLELGARGLRQYPVKYSEYTVVRKEEMAREQALVTRQQQLISKTEDFIRKNTAGQKSKQAESRRKMLGKLERLERPEDVWAVADKIAFRFAPAERTGDIVLEATGLGASRGDRTLFSGLDLLVRRGERIAMVGPNGAGKSTLLKLLAGRGLDEDSGRVRRGTNLREGYFDQHLGDVQTNLTAVDEVRRIRGDFTVETARQYLARFRFWGDDPLRVVGGFSGGERARLALAKLLLEPRNLLFLDEPTNHLDIPAAEILEEALVGFEGTVIFVSHDRRFLENVATRIVSVRDGVADVYPGGFADFVHFKQGLLKPKEEPPAAKPVKAKGAAPPPVVSEAEKRAAYEAERQRSRAAERRKKRIAELELLIAKSETDLDDLRTRLKNDPGGDWPKLSKWATQEQELTVKLEEMMTEWGTLSEASS